MRSLPALIAATALLAISGSTGAAVAAEPIQPTMTLTGIGEITTEPDMAVITSGVLTQAKTAREALSANNDAMANLMELLAEQDIEPTDIRTSNFSVQPEYIYPESNGSNVRRINSYTVSNDVTVRIRDLEKLGPLLDTMVSVGANQIRNVNFAVADTTELYVEARKAAVADALAKATLYADAAGIELGPIITISESSAPMPRAPEAAMMRMASDSSVPVAAGELAYSSSVTIQWSIGE